MIRIPTHRKPTHPGEILWEEFLNPMGLTQRKLAIAIHVPYQRVNDIVNARSSITPSTALRLAKFFNMSAGFWMNLQMRWDMYFAHQDEMEILKTIEPFHSVHWGKRTLSFTTLWNIMNFFSTNRTQSRLNHPSPYLIRIECIFLFLQRSWVQIPSGLLSCLANLSYCGLVGVPSKW